jgi:hypothetical protein
MEEVGMVGIPLRLTSKLIEETEKYGREGTGEVWCKTKH